MNENKGNVGERWRWKIKLLRWLHKCHCEAAGRKMKAFVENLEVRATSQSSSQETT